MIEMFVNPILSNRLICREIVQKESVSHNVTTSSSSVWKVGFDFHREQKPKELSGIEMKLSY